MKCSDIRQYFIDELKAERFTIDRLGSKTIELIGANFIADEKSIFGKVSEKYVDAELKWYDSESTNINDIYGSKKEPPEAWKYAASPHGEINSNYGHLIYSRKYHNQYSSCLNTLLSDSDSRRAIMIYTRPSIQVEFNENGKSDFICTNAVSYFIRGDQMHAVVQMRSNDSVFGYKNDRSWAFYVLQNLVRDYNRHADSPVCIGDIHWQVSNLHVYERHFDLVK